MRYFCLLLFLGFSLCCSAQKTYKHEKEERIEKKVFPQNALHLLEETLPKKIKKAKYYKEQDSSKISYETKLKYKGRKYSVEFSQKGILEDVEVTVKQKHIPPKTLEKIKKHLYNNYSAFRFIKIQRQYNNSNTIDAETVIKNAFSNDRKSPYLYEIIVEVKTKKKRYFIEITFTKDGDFKMERTIIQSSYDHILY
ncbi:hypothetical protein [Kordia sp.]|uniref:hypothetical protein n=1 Tax=Kordia sp. TaxID=1965332 RepID=UPI0025BF2A57|nr:hypothetical protein [Kordia sp.]MCH2192550.1 hypothetical protein [Kordia sp.]